LRGIAFELLALAVPLAWLAWTLREPLASLGQAPWGAADPWGNGDFVGNIWCWWREAEWQRSGTDWLQATSWPGSGAALQQLFPNRVDAWLALPFFAIESWWLSWNGLALASLVLTALGAHAACRLAGASRPASACAALVLVASPTLLHELGWGRMASFMLWPGVLSLAALAAALRWQRAVLSAALGATSGLLLALQAVAYPFHGLVGGLAFGSVLALAELPRRRRAIVAGAVALGGACVAVPWLVGMGAHFAALAQGPPPVGYTSLPGAGLLGLSTVPERFQLLPLAVPLALAALAPRRSRPWALAGLAGLLLALGPRLGWIPGGRTFTSPLAWAMDALPWLARMHHPVRAAPLGLAALAVATALLLDPWPRGHRPGAPRIDPGAAAGGQASLKALRLAGLAAVVIAAIATSDDAARVTTWLQNPYPPGVQAARWLALQDDGPVLDLLSGEHMAGLSLQPWHRRPLVESAYGFAPAPGESWSEEQQVVALLAAELARGGDAQGDSVQQLRSAGVRHLLLVDRRGSRPDAPEPDAARALISAALGEPDYRDDEAWVWTL